MRLANERGCDLGRFCSDYLVDLVDRVSVEDLRGHVLPVHVGRDVEVSGYVGRWDFGREERSLPVPVLLGKFNDGGDDRSWSYSPSEVGNLVVTGVLDTGAESLCVKRGLPEKLNWLKVGKSVVSGATGRSEVNVWRGGGVFGKLGCLNDSVTFRGVFLEADLPGDVSVLIGRPILSQFKLTVGVGFKYFSLEEPEEKGKGVGSVDDLVAGVVSG